MSTVAIVIVLVLVLVAAYGFYCYYTRPAFVVQPPAAVWDPNGNGVYTCPGSLGQGWCFLPRAAGEAYCLADPRCVGFITPESGFGIAGNPDAVCLVSSTPIPAPAHPNTLFYKKNK
jgi:hypothetical protein